MSTVINVPQASAYQAQLKPRSLSIASVKLAAPITKVDGVVKKYVFDVEFNKGGGTPGLAGRVEQLTVQSDSLHNALKALHTVGEHAATMNDSKYHQMITKLKAGCTKFDFRADGTSTGAHCHDWNAHTNSFDMESRSSVTLSRQQLQEIDMLVDGLDGDISTVGDDLDYDMDPHSHIEMTRSHTGGTGVASGRGVRVHVKKDNADVKDGATSAKRKEQGDNEVSKKPKEQDDGNVSTAGYFFNLLNPLPLLSSLFNQQGYWEGEIYQYEQD